MIFFIEGISKSGKTTLINRYLEKYPETILFKGDGQVRMGIDDQWVTYNWYMHNIIERLDQMNHYTKTILWDRGLSEAVIGDEKWARLSSAHVSKALVYINMPKRILLDRRSSAGPQENISVLEDGYERLGYKFSSFIIKPKEPDYFITDEHIKELHTFIQESIIACTSKNLKK